MQGPGVQPLAQSSLVLATVEMCACAVSYWVLLVARKTIQRKNSLIKKVILLKNVTEL